MGAHYECSEPRRVASSTANPREKLLPIMNASASGAAMWGTSLPCLDYARDGKTGLWQARLDCHW